MMFTAAAAHSEPIGAKDVHVIYGDTVCFQHQRASLRRGIVASSTLPAFISPCFETADSYLIGMMKLTDIHDQAIQARMALVVGAKTFDQAR